MAWTMWWPWLAGTFGVLVVVVAVVAAAHVVLNKRDVRAAIGWVGLIVLSPVVGAISYYVLGINRIRRRAARLVAERPSRPKEALLDPPETLEAEGDPHLRRLSATIWRTTGRPLVAGNRVMPLVDGDEAYPAMLDAITSAERSILLLTYIFDDDAVGRRFVDALADAVERGVSVRVLIDAVGARYSRPPTARALLRRGVRTADFLPPRLPLPLRSAYMNLRNHRKLMVVDGETAFFGGMNIRGGCLLEDACDEMRDGIHDVHFQVTGPVVDQLFAVAAQDWHFTTREALTGPPWSRPVVDDGPKSMGPTQARVIPDGPDEDFENLRWTLMAAITSARHSVRIVTPYFLPEAPLLATLRLAALRGVAVEILLPERNNLRVVQWASTAQLWEVLEPGCRVWLTPPPFDHSKLFVVDDAWCLVGSTNWDARSLRLNFELGVECHDVALARRLGALIDAKRAKSRELTLEEVDGRALPIRLRDGLARLFAPYL